MMTRTMNGMSAVAALLLVVAAGCAMSKKTQQSEVNDDINRTVTLPDGSTCMGPAGPAESREKPGAVALRELLQSRGTRRRAGRKAPPPKPQPGQGGGVYFEACRAY